MRKKIVQTEKKQDPVSYNPKLSPLNNIEKLFSLSETLMYSLTYRDLPGPDMNPIFKSHWGTSTELRKKIIRWESDFLEQLILFSVSKEFDYAAYLNGLRIELVRINGHFAYPAEGKFNLKICDEKTGRTVTYQTFDFAPKEIQKIIELEHLYFKTLFKNLQEIVTGEKSELKRLQYVYTESPFKWNTDKNKLTELICGLWWSETVTNKDGKRPSTAELSRDLSAFFGVKNPTYGPDIRLLRSRVKLGKGLIFDTCKESLVKYFDDLDKAKITTKKS